MTIRFLPVPVQASDLIKTARYAVIRDDDSACQISIPMSGIREPFYYLPGNRANVLKHACMHAKVHGLTYKTLKEACFQAELQELLEG